ncbi:MAG: glycosyltransferase family 39 protein [Actinobacteria bacterium]|nr:glycosyltransferase family 39 protein [Actinomycetota bacterium]
MRSYRAQLSLVVVAGLAIRLLYALHYARRTPLNGDAETFQRIAQHLIDGHGFTLANVGRRALRATAEKPPLYPLLLAPVQGISRGWVSQQVLNSLLGAGTVGAIGVLARRVGGRTVGLVAASLAAVYPVFLATDGSLRSETLYGLAVTCLLIGAYAAWDRPGRRLFALGALIGVAALVRAEALLFLPLLGVLLARRAPRARALQAAVVCAGCLVAIAPWTIRNLLAFDRFVPISTNEASLVEGANCEGAYYGKGIGGWDPRCVHRRPGNQADEATVERREGLRYARRHLGRLPVVMGVRVAKTWGFYRPDRQWHEEEFYEGRDYRTQVAGTVMYFSLFALAGAGLVILRRRAQTLFILLAPPIAVTVTSALGYGVIRFRQAAEVSLIVLAAITIAAGAGALGSRFARRADQRA